MPGRFSDTFPVTHSLTIANGQSLSDGVDIGSWVLCGIVMPSAWTAANLTFQAAADGDDAASATYNDLYDKAGTEYTVTAAASRHIIIDPADFAGVRFLKIRSGTAATPVNQAAARTIKIVFRRL